jgi:hypothetical protein
MRVDQDGKRRPGESMIVAPYPGGARVRRLWWLCNTATSVLCLALHLNSWRAAAAELWAGEAHAQRSEPTPVRRRAMGPRSVPADLSMVEAPALC